MWLQPIFFLDRLKKRSFSQGIWVWISKYCQCRAGKFNTFSPCPSLPVASDLDECEPNNAAENDERPQCQHFCHNYVGGYFCSCRIGYQLQSDHHSCKGKEKF